jgi:hypothetical protein
MPYPVQSTFARRLRSMSGIMIELPTVARSAVRALPWLSCTMRAPIELPPVSRICSSFTLGKCLLNASTIFAA